jgi:peptidoglycan-associated lipoprotein
MLNPQTARLLDNQMRQKQVAQRSEGAGMLSGLTQAYTGMADALTGAAGLSPTGVNEQKAIYNEQKIIQAAKTTAMQKEADIEEQNRQELERIRAEHIVYFDFDVSSVSSDSSELLDAHAKFLNANTGVNVLVEGHADERGTPEYNIALGERRAKAIVTYFQNMGVSAAQITMVSYGEEKPMVKDRSEAAFSKNRRAVLVY